MPERYTLTAVAEVAAALGAEVGADVQPRFNIAPGQDAPVVRAGKAGPRTAALLRWGLLPRWRGHGGKRAPMIERASLAEVDATPLLRDALARQRCLVAADGYFAWQRTSKARQPYWHRAPGVAALAGIWATSRDDDRPSFAILVEGGAPLVVGPAHHAAWLAGPADAARAALAPAAWRAVAVSAWVNAVEHDDPRCIAPLGNPDQGELF